MVRGMKILWAAGLTLALLLGACNSKDEGTTEEEGGSETIKAPLSHTGDWANWRGPHYNGSSDETNLPAKFSPTENVLWKTPMPGEGAGTPIILGNRVFVSSSERNGSGLFGMCVDRDTGDVLWKKNLAEGKPWRPRNNLASASVVSDGKRAFFTFASGDLIALDFEGEEVWSRNLEKEYGPFSILWIYSSTPLYHDGKLYVEVLRNVKPLRKELRDSYTGKLPLDSYLLCLDPATGENIWKVARETDAVEESPEAYSTPIPFEYKGRREILIAGGDYVTGHDPETGKEYWRQHFNPTKNPRWRLVPSPVTCGDTIVGVQARITSSVFAFKAGLSGRKEYDEVLWTYSDSTTDSGTPLLYRGRLYFIHDSKHIITCLDPKTGKKFWEGDLGGKKVIRASPTGADGKIYCINEEGFATVLEAGDEFKILSQTDMGGSVTYSSIAVADKKLFIRTSENLYCVANKP